MMPCFHFCYPIFLHFFLFMFLSYFSSSLPLCNHDQSSALLHFKNSFSLDSEASWDCDENHNSSYPKTESWENGTDCCSWDRVSCDSVSGNVIGLDLSCSWLQGTFHQNTSLFQLTHLQALNLAFNHFNGSPMPSHFARLHSLTYLNLSESGFAGEIPSTISHLSKLTSLDLSSSFLLIEPSPWEKLIRNATDLRELVFDGVNMSFIKPSSLYSSVNLSSSLVSLSLGYTKLQGNLSDNIFRLPNLQKLDMSDNQDLKIQLPKSNWSTPLKHLDLFATKYLEGNLSDSLGHLKSLNYLALSDFELPGIIPPSFGNLKQLQFLDLSSCKLQEPIPPSFWNLKQLTTLRLGSNNFNCQIPSALSNFQHLTSLALSWNNFIGAIPNMFNQLKNLEQLRLSNNNLEGPIPNSIFDLVNLTTLTLSSNNLSGHLKFQQFSKLKNLRDLDLSENKFLSLNFDDTTNLQGPISNTLFDLVNLSSLILSSMNLSGHIEFHQFSKLKNLYSLDLSNNIFLSISFDDTTNYTIPDFEYLSLSSCNIDSTFPKILTQLKSLYNLDLSNNKIHGKVPKWLNVIEKDFYYYLNLSYNHLTSVQNISWKNIQIIDLSHNVLQGDIPIPSSKTTYFSVLNNKLTGDISSAICNASSIEELILSHNNFTGPIPQCIGNFPSLSVLDLQMNHFSQTILSNICKRGSLWTLKLNSNQLEGPLPRSLTQCKELRVLDVGENNIKDVFPSWLDTLSELQVLILRANKLYGIILRSKTKHPFLKLRIFYVSNNSFSGPLPVAYIKNFKGMMNMDTSTIGLQYLGRSSYYSDSVVVMVKGLFRELEKILITFTTIDLSKNSFEGEIPEVIGKLNSLKRLNLSHNKISGTIPQSLGNLRSLEWLDLSSNKLKGKIPTILANLNFLEVLNLSQNQLEGIIPQEQQFLTFSNESYVGNPMLCGPPLSRKCNNDEEQSPSSSTSGNEKEEFGFGWKVVAFGYGCGMVFGMVMGYVMFSIGKPEWLVKIFGGDPNKMMRRRMRSKNNTNRSRRN